MTESSFEIIRWRLAEKLREEGDVVDVGEWQSIRGAIPQARTIEVQDVHFQFRIPETVESLQRVVHPNLPWAEDHFHERVGGEPLNPGEQYKNWPWYKGNVEVHKRPGKFSHTYMERFWPKWAGEDGGQWNYDRCLVAQEGIRYKYGDLQDVVSLLARSPATRQAYLPVWFPEDTGAVHGARVPCTLGYHFLLRDGFLNVYYFIRSCDFYRHFADDVYLACRLCQWVLDQLQNPVDSNWVDVKPGNLIMQISSLHIFEDERARLETK